MRNYFILDGVDSRDFGVYISGQGTFSAPARSYDMISIPGRSGDLYKDNNRLENGVFTYPAFICRDFKNNIESLRAFLLSLRGYKVLTDSYDTEKFRQVVFEGDFDPDVTAKNDAASFDISFNAKPQRFLNSGQQTTTLTANGTITNPTRYDAQPLLRVYGTGTFYVGSVAVTISAANTYTDIDCEMMDAYKGTENRNAFVSVSGYKFPVLAPGGNGIRLGTGITQIIVTPRFWTV